MAGKGVWCLDVGSHAIKALKAHRAGSRIEISVFDVVEYDRPLDYPEVDAPEQIEKALMRFLHRNDAERDKVLVSVSGQSALFRFIPLPPVGKGKVPEIVRYEARQQIPFPLEEVVWDYDTLDRGSKSSEQIEVGLFAMKKELIFQALAPFRSLGFDIDAIQLVPNALYNFLTFEKPQGAEAHIILDIGARCTNLVVVNEEVVWPRILQIAGSDFTQTIQETFDIPYSKAEKLKKRVKKHKYADKIYKSLRPTLDRLVDEVQRSMGFFKSTHKGVRIESVVAMGGAFKLPGMIKYLEDHLNYDVKTISSLQNFDIERALNPQLFRDNILSFGVCLGLAVQGLFPERSIDVSLLPEQFLFNKIVQRKRPWAAGIAAVVGVAVLASGFKEMGRQLQIDDAQPTLQKAERLISTYRSKENEYKDAWEDIDPLLNRIDRLKKLFRVRGNYLQLGTVGPDGEVQNNALYRTLFEAVQPEPWMSPTDVTDWPAFAKSLTGGAGRAYLEALDGEASQAVQKAAGGEALTGAEIRRIVTALNEKALVDREIATRPAMKGTIAKLGPLAEEILERLKNDSSALWDRDVAWLNRSLLEAIAGQSLAEMPEQFIWLSNVIARPYPREVWLWEIDRKLKQNNREPVFFTDDTARHGDWRVSGRGEGRSLEDGFGTGYDKGFFGSRSEREAVRLTPLGGEDGGGGGMGDYMGDPMMGMGGGGSSEEQPEQGKPEAIRKVLDRADQPDQPVIRVQVYGQLEADGAHQNLLQDHLQNALNRTYYPAFATDEAPVKNVELKRFQFMTVYRSKETNLWVKPENVDTIVSERLKATNIPRERASRPGFLEAKRQEIRNRMFEQLEIMLFRIEFTVDPTGAAPAFIQRAIEERREAVEETVAATDLGQ